MAAARRRCCTRAARAPLPRSGARARGPLRQLGRAVRRSRPGRVDRPAEGDRALRRGARRAVPDLRDADDRGRDPALLPRPRLGGARAALGAGAARARQRHDRPVERRARRGADDGRARAVPRRLARRHPRCDPQRERALGARAAERRGRSRRVRLRRADRGARASTRSTRACCWPAVSRASPSASARSWRCASRRGCTQSQIAARIGISQMHVSRLLRRALSQLRSSVGDVDRGDSSREAGRRRAR